MVLPAICDSFDLKASFLFTRAEYTGSRRVRAPYLQLLVAQTFRNWRAYSCSYAKFGKSSLALRKMLLSTRR